MASPVSEPLWRASAYTTPTSRFWMNSIEFGTRNEWHKIVNENEAYNLPWLAAFGMSAEFIPRAKNSGRTMVQFVGTLVVGPPCTSDGAVDESAACWADVNCNSVTTTNTNNPYGCICVFAVVPDNVDEDAVKNSILLINWSVHAMRKSGGRLKSIEWQFVSVSKWLSSTCPPTIQCLSQSRFWNGNQNWIFGFVVRFGNPTRSHHSNDARNWNAICGKFKWNLKAQNAKHTHFRTLW